MLHSVLRAVLLSPLCLFIALHASTALGVEPDGSRPMNVAVSPDGNTVLATSMGSTGITQLKWNGSDYDRSFIEVNAPSWGIVFVNAYLVAVTHPDFTSLSILTRASLSAGFIKDRDIELGDQFRYSTEVIMKPGTRNVFVANRGVPLNGQESWTNAIFRVNLQTDQITGTMVTEREPRALALSPNANRLFVGHVQGSVGGNPLVPNHPLANNKTGDLIGDGGSILVYDISTWNEPEMPVPDQRIGVGSPVRGIALTGNSDGSYVVYFTSVGDNANSEDPEDGIQDPDANPEFFGGREIPNVISALYYSSSNVLQDAPENAVFDHHPEWTPDETPFPAPEGYPAVLPDKLVVRDVTIGGQRTRELFITNSGSGTLSRTPLDTDGSLQSIGTVSVKRVTLERSPATNEITISTPEEVSYAKLAVITNGPTNESHVDLSRSTNPLVFPPRFTSNTRAVAYNAATDKIWVATQFDNQMIRVTPGISTNVLTRYDIADAVAADERSFFGFGRGFLFREVESSNPHDQTPTVGSQSCATCHVDGHLDGKVRLTRRRIENKSQMTTDRKPVAVPSCFDVGKTEWIFFEGLRTIVDGQFVGGSACLYCNVNAFFDDTESLTNALASPPSPHNPQGVLSGNTLRGRYLFEAMNCSRCHMGSPAPFLRTLQNGGDLPNEDPMGPLTLTNQFLHDPTQVFVTLATLGGLNSLRNMTDVGTRPPGDGKILGLNTPALAGLWDNRPYMHDGRYRTLDEVLEHTWLEEDEGFRAARLVPCDSIPDNVFDGYIGDTTPFGTKLNSIKHFGTHGAEAPGSGWTAVATKLSPVDKSDLEAFLLSLSSHTDPCSGGDPDFVLNLMVTSAGVVKCSSPVKIQCRFDWDGPSQWSETTAWGTLHASSLPPGMENGTYVVTVTPLVRPICGCPDIEAIAVDIPGGPSLTASHSLPSRTELSAPRPNPFNPSTTIAFSLAQDGNVSVIVYDVSGKRVRTLVDEHRRRERYTVEWNGRDDAGSPVASGVYFCKMIAGNHQFTQKLVLLK